MATQSLPTSLSSTGGTGRDYAWNDALNRSGMEPLVPSEEQLQLFRNYEVQTCQEGGVEIVVRVPKTIADGTVEDHFGYMFSFGGGGFTTGHPNFLPWVKPLFKPIYNMERPPTEIAIAYLMLPEHTARQAHEHMDKTLFFILSGGLQSWMANRFPAMTAKLKPKKICCLGVSAGCYWALIFWAKLEQMVKEMQAEAKIIVIYFLYSMDSSYSRTCNQEYHGHVFSKEELRKIALDIIDDAADCRLTNTVQAGRTPPAFMGNLPITTTVTRASINGREPDWVEWWLLLRQGRSMLDFVESWVEEQRMPPERRRIAYTKNHPLDESGKVKIDAADVKAKLEVKLENLDLRYNAETNALELEIDETPLPQPSYLPYIISSHGNEDENCPIEDRDRTLDLLHGMFPNARVERHTVEGGEHGYDNFPGSEQQMQRIMEAMGW